VDAKSKPVTKPAGKKPRKPPVAPAGATARKPAPAAKTALAPAKKTAPPEPVKKALAPAVQQKAPAKAAPKPTDAKPAAAPARPAAKIPVKPAIAPAVAKPVLPVVPRPQTPVMRLVPRMPGKILPRQFLFGLAQAIKDAVAPVARSLKGREIVSTAQTGDATFELDRVAEKALLTYLKNARAPIAYYSEDAGYSTFSNAQPKHLLVVDPVDGTRAAKSGFEGCVISVASTRVIERPTMADVDNACVMELLGDRTFYSERGAGARVYVQESVRKPKLSPNTNLERLTWTMTVPARPAELIFPTAARLIDLSSLKGGFFACNSTSYSLTRLLTNQVDACVDFAARYMKDIPDLVRDYFLNAGRGVVLGIAPYDFAAALLIAQEAGCVLTDAYGKVFDNVLLLDSSASNHQSLIAAASHDLHQKLLSFFDTRIRQFETLLARRAAAQAARRAAE
jgi:myo-inositol-1(or 4)-monophosphatase